MEKLRIEEAANEESGFQPILRQVESPCMAFKESPWAAAQRVNRDTPHQSTANAESGFRARFSSERVQGSIFNHAGPADAHHPPHHDLI
jgi:hypothetical protein